MRVISRGRQCGKTYEAVQWVKAEPGRVLLVIDEAERLRLIRQYGLSREQVMRAEGAKERLVGRLPLDLSELAVDNIDLLGWRTVLDLGRMAHRIELATETR
jgi:ParB-like chromosome segregation protein Spo0J